MIETVVIDLLMLPPLSMLRMTAPQLWISAFPNSWIWNEVPHPVASYWVASSVFSHLLLCRLLFFLSSFLIWIILLCVWLLKFPLMCHPLHLNFLTLTCISAYFTGNSWGWRWEHGRRGGACDQDSRPQQAPSLPNHSSTGHGWWRVHWRWGHLDSTFFYEDHVEVANPAHNGTILPFADNEWGAQGIFSPQFMSASIQTHWVTKLCISYVLRTRITFVKHTYPPCMCLLFWCWVCSVIGAEFQCGLVKQQL